MLDTKAKHSAFTFLIELDTFGSCVPTFNIAGQSKVKTMEGSCASIIIFALTLFFGLIKLQQLTIRKNPLINANIGPLPKLMTYDTSQTEFKIAVAAENYETGAGISDPRYVRWVAIHEQHHLPHA